MLYIYLSFKLHIFLLKKNYTKHNVSRLSWRSSVVTILYVCIIIKQSHVHANKDFSISVYIYNMMKWKQKITCTHILFSS